MDVSWYRIRAHRDADVEAEVGLWGRIYPGDERAPEQVRHVTRILSAPPLFEVTRIVEDGETGRAVAVGAVAPTPEAYDPHRFYVGVGVDPSHQGRGIGRALAEAILREARARGARSVLVVTRADAPRSAAFVARQGFVERRRKWRSRLDLANAHPLPDRTEELARQGITFTTWADEAAGGRDVRDRLIDLELAAGEDVPRTDPYTPATMRNFLVEVLAATTLIPEAYFLAVHEGRYVGTSYLERLPAQPGVLQLAFTGTLREARRRGIATELKRRTAEYGRDRGYRSIVTSNDSLNRAMWSINERQGYRREEEWIESELDLTGATPGPRGP